LQLNFADFTPTGHDVLFLVDNTGDEATSGTFQYAEGADIGRYDGVDWHITYHADAEGSGVAMVGLSGGNDVAIYSVPVPEPSTLALAAIGVAMLAGLAWRRRY
jgi:hypothetical protein